MNIEVLINLQIDGYLTERLENNIILAYNFKDNNFYKLFENSKLNLLKINNNLSFNLDNFIVTFSEDFHPIHKKLILELPLFDKNNKKLSRFFPIFEINNVESIGVLLEKFQPFKLTNKTKLGDKILTELDIKF